MIERGIEGAESRPTGRSKPPQVEGSGPSSRAWLFRFGAAFVASALGTGLALSALTSLESLGSPIAGHWTSVRFDKRMEYFIRPEPAPGSLRVVMLGDSTLAAYPQNQRLPNYVAHRLNSGSAAPRHTDVLDFAYIGAGTVTAYFWADRVAALSPDLVIWQISLLHFSDWWRRDSLRPDLAGWIGFERWGDLLRLPLHEMGIRFDAFLLDQLIVRAGLFDPVGWIADRQKKLRSGRTALDRWLAASLGLRAQASFDQTSRLRRSASLQDGRQQPNLAGQRLYLSPVLDGVSPEHPVLQILAGALEFYEAHDIPVLAYLTPVNMDQLAAVGALEGDGLDVSVSRIRDVVEARGATFLDLHDLLPAHAFSDVPHHYTSPPKFDAKRPLSRQIALAARKLLSERENGTPRGKRTEARP
jgi:hypothetical protein